LKRCIRGASNLKEANYGKESKTQGESENGTEAPQAEKGEKVSAQSR
jgi:hypothetical protein